MNHSATTLDPRPVIDCPPWEIRLDGAVCRINTSTDSDSTVRCLMEDLRQAGMELDWISGDLKVHAAAREVLTAMLAAGYGAEISAPMTPNHANHVLDHEDEYSAATGVAANALLEDHNEDGTFHKVGVALPPLDTRPSLGVSAGFADDQRAVDEGEMWDAQSWHAATRGC